MQKYFGVLGALLCLVILLTCMPQKTVNEEAKPSPQDGAEAALPGVTEAAGERTAESDTTAGKGIRAVSLSVLQNRLQQSQPAAGTMKMAGLTSITGYVEDKSNQDLVLLGTTNASLPPLHTEDFVVALRYAFLKYAEFKDNTYYYSYPGCSIDPQPEVLAELQQVGDQILSSTSLKRINAGIESWNRICRAPQVVSVTGIPFNSRFARVLVEADYMMKSVVDGSETLDIPGLTSLTEMNLNQIRADIDQNREISIPFSTLNRFWFYSGKNVYREDAGIVVLDQTPVELLTEAEYLNKSGQRVGKGQADPMAQRFARAFSETYPLIARQRPIYIELENLFRFIALAQVITFKDAHSHSGIDLAHLVDRFAVVRTPVKDRLPGRAHVKKYVNSREIKGGRRTTRFWLPSCGGVTIDIRPGPDDFQPDRSGALLRLKEAVLKGRKSRDSLSWDVDPVP